jgi:hypothetical protein
MSADDACRELATRMTDDDLLAGLCALGPDSPLLPAVRAEVRRRLEAANTAATARKDPA